MLHVFDAVDGRELFAYVPNLVFENLKELTKPTYSHRFYVDQTPVTKDGVTIATDTQITLLVGGLGKGGKGYYALDITDPSAITNETELAAKVLWEYPRTGYGDPDADDLGYSYGRPSIVMSNDSDRWLVIFSNGYNSPKGHAVLFIVDPADGSLIKKIDTGAGNCNGLSTPVAIDINADQKVDYVYAGDLKGNLWKFDLTGNISNWKVAFNESGTPKPLFQAKDGINPQPITTKPDVMYSCESDGLMVVFGTGKYLGDSDFLDNSLQTIYGIWDYSDPTDPSEYLGSFERGSVPQLSNQPDPVILLQQTQLAGDYFAPNGKRLRILSANTPNWETTTLEADGVSCTPGAGEGITGCDPNDVGENPDPIHHAGWYFDLPVSGERVPNDLMIRNKNAVVIGFIPENTPCGTGGDSFVMEMDACSGGRLNSPQFDINDDGKVDDNDMVALTDCDGNTFCDHCGKTFCDCHGNPIMVVPTGMMSPGRLLPPAILKTGNEEIKYFSTNVGTIVTMREKSVSLGIIYWVDVISQ
jgi:type IV pilus assembly protein PilY1